MLHIHEVQPSSALSTAHLRSVVAPGGAPPLLLLLAFSGPREEPVASLSLASGPSAFSRRASALRLPAASGCERAELACALLRHAVHAEPLLRNGGALLARAATPETAAELMNDAIGFVPTECTKSDDPSPGPLLAFASRRAPEEAADGSHAALHVSNIERAAAFWSLFDFAPTRAFTTSGARALWLASPWASLGLELIELPARLLPPDAEERGGAKGLRLGVAHLCLDCTPIGTSLPPTLSRLESRSRRRFGRELRVVTPPRQQMMGSLVAEVATVCAPDGVMLELIHRSVELPRDQISPDWVLRCNHL